MGNKSLSSPIPSYEAANSCFNPSELIDLKKKFSILSQTHCLSQGNDTISHECFLQISKSANCEYVRKYILPRIFLLFDTKKDGIIDFDEYLCAVALFRAGTVEEKIKFLYLLYDGNKSGGSLIKENLRQLLVDSTVCAQKDEIPLNILDEWINDMLPLSDAMVEAALIQYSSKSGKLDVQEFISFAKIEGTLQGLLHSIATMIDFNS